MTRSSPPYPVAWTATLLQAAGKARGPAHSTLLGSSRCGEGWVPSLDRQACPTDRPGRPLPGEAVPRSRHLPVSSRWRSLEGPKPQAKVKEAKYERGFRASLLKVSEVPQPMTPDADI